MPDCQTLKSLKRVRDKYVEVSESDRVINYRKESKDWERIQQKDEEVS